MFTNIPSLAYCHEHLVEYFERPIQNMSQVVTGAFGHVDNLHMEWHGNASYRWGAAMSFLYNLHHGQGTFPHIPSDSQVPRLTCFQEQVGWEPEFLYDCNLAIFFPFSWIRNLFSPSFWLCNVLRQGREAAMISKLAPAITALSKILDNFPFLLSHQTIKLFSIHYSLFTIHYSLSITALASTLSNYYYEKVSWRLAKASSTSSLLRRWTMRLTQGFSSTSNRKQNTCIIDCRLIYISYDHILYIITWMRHGVNRWWETKSDPS